MKRCPPHPSAQEMLDLVAELYIAEHAADAQGLLGDSKLAFRKERAGPVRERMRGWLLAQKERHPRKSCCSARGQPPEMKLTLRPDGLGRTLSANRPRCARNTRP